MHFQELKNSLTLDAPKAPIMRNDRGVIRFFDNKNSAVKKEESADMALTNKDLQEIKETMLGVGNGVSKALGGAVSLALDLFIKQANEQNDRLRLRNTAQPSATPDSEPPKKGHGRF